MSNNTILMIAAVALVIVLSIGVNIKKRNLFQKLQSLLAHEQYDELFQLLDAPLTRLLYPEYNLSYFKLNAYLVKEDIQAANKLLEELLSRKLSKRQRYDLVIKGFNIYLSQENRKRAQELLEEIESWQDEQMNTIQHDCRRTYDIVILDSSNYIDEMEQELEGAQGMARGRIEYFLALQYENRGDHAKHDEYLERASSDSFQAPKKS